MKYEILYDGSEVYTVFDLEDQEPVMDFDSRQKAEDFIKIKSGVFFGCFICGAVEHISNSNNRFDFCLNEYTNQKICESCYEKQCDEEADYLCEDDDGDSFPYI